MPTLSLGPSISTSSPSDCLTSSSRFSRAIEPETSRTNVRAAGGRASSGTSRALTPIRRSVSSGAMNGLGPPSAWIAKASSSGAA
jgi:hypothetical protein